MGQAKLQQVREWADAQGVDLKASSAHSDSYYDAPLLAAVGEPVAVNPDVPLAALANLRGWPTRHLDVPAGVLKIAGRELQEWMRPIQRQASLPNARVNIDGTDHIPRHGLAIVVFNHRSYFDGTVVSMALARANRAFRFLGKKEVFDAPVIGMFTRLTNGRHSR